MWKRSLNAGTLAVCTAVSIAVLGCARSGPGEESPQAPLFTDLGNHHHPITTRSTLAQQFFDQGLTLAYAFNHAEAARAFREAARLDPECAMCYWGLALALGPNINKPMAAEDVPDAFEAAQTALALAPRASEAEQAYIEALASRYAAEPPDDRAPLDLAYANAMRDVARRYPDDLDAATLFAESLMDLMPWDYYVGEGTPKAETAELIAVLESVLSQNPDHPGAIHYYIHAVEASPTPARAEAAADRLGDLVPAAGHLVHMPSHIYLRIGRYQDASIANEAAAAADESYIAQCNAQGFYPALYYPHNIHFLWFTSSMEGRSAVAIDAATKLINNVPRELVPEIAELEGLLPTRLFALARFGKWEEILTEPEPSGELAYEAAMSHYARGLAFLGRGQVDEAAREAAGLTDIAEHRELAPLNSSLVGIAAHILAAEIAGRAARHSEAVEHLEAAVRLQDELPYMEPPYWYFPVRQFLGAALLQAGRAADAEAVYRADLEQTPRNGWSLYGLAEALRAQGKRQEADEVHELFEDVWALADVELAASRF